MATINKLPPSIEISTKKITYSFKMPGTMPETRPSIQGISHNEMYEADLIVASTRGKTCVLKNRYDESNDTKIIDVVCQLLSCHVFGNQYKLFISAFEEDIKEAIEGVMNKHHLDI